MLPVHNETILAYFQRTQDLSREITLARDASGMLHELLHHFLQSLCANGDSGFTRTTLSYFDRTIKLPSSASSLPVFITTLVIWLHASPGYTRCLHVVLSNHTTRRPPFNSATLTPNLYAALLTTPNWLFSLIFDFILHIHQNTTFLYFFLIAHYIRIILREVILYPLLHLLFNFHLSGSFEALRFSSVGGGCWGYSVSPGIPQFPGLRITPYWRYRSAYLRTLYFTHFVSLPTYAHHHRLARP
jgi:hypothetical protein